MLKVFRQRKSTVKVLLYGIVGLVGLMMVVTLVPGLGGGRTDLFDRQDVLARVDKQIITEDDVRREYTRRSRAFGGENDLFRNLILEQAMKELIEEKVVEYEADRLGFEVPPEVLSQQLKQIPWLYPEGKFIGAESYRTVVQSEFSLTVPEFEHMVARRTKTSRLVAWVTSGVVVGPADIERAYRQQREQVQIEYAVLSTDEFARRLQPSEAELRDYFEKNKDRYAIPERRAVRTVWVSEAVLAGRVQVSPRELQTYYDGHRAEYFVPEQVRVRQILLLKRPPAGAAPRDAAQLRQTAEQALAEAKRGKDFAGLVKQYSDDQSSRAKGGELGWVQRGQAAPEVDQKLFSMKPGSIELIETGYGFHVAQVLEHQPEHYRPLAEVQPQIESVLKQQNVRQRAEADARRLVEAVRGGKTLDAAAQEQGWAVQDVPPFARGESTAPFGDNPEFQDWVFRVSADNVGKTVSDPIPVMGGSVVAQVKQVLAAHPGAFEEVRDKVAQAYRNERGALQARETAEKLAAEAKAGGDLKRAARALGVEVKTSDRVTRDQPVPGLGPLRSLAGAFSLPEGAVSDAVEQGGNRVVFKVLARQTIDPNQISLGEREALRQQLLQEKRGFAWALYIEALQKRLKAEKVLEINEETRKRILGTKT
ncbi:MAG TPA: peptidyl-prolyl cis-trans isomerase [Candidatus Acidoferrales bacterium]|nr:peptidyl-prolyl cis-trans isomerase [Candidatus Acidoferrales bacterium]